MSKYDVVVIGAGPGGYVSAIRAAQLGAKVCLIEKNRVGGTCLHRGCIPSKSFISSVKALKAVKSCAEFGIEFSGEAKPNISTIKERTKKVIEQLEKGISHLLNAKGVDLIHGAASFLSSDKLSVVDDDGNEREIEAAKTIIAVGSSPASIPVFQGVEVLTTDTIFSIGKIPASLTIVGGGVTGCEFASIFSGLGSNVVILEAEPQLLPGEDPGIVKILAREFKKNKVCVLCGEKVTRVENRNGWKSVFPESGEEIPAEAILVTVGRNANTAGLGLEALGTLSDSKGNIPVNEKMETSVPGIYAIGDVTGNWLLAHVASKEGIIAAENAVGMESSMDYSAIPATVFTTPEIGSVGLSSHQAEKKGFKVKVGTFPVRALGKARITNELAGEVRLTIDEESEKLLGARIIGPAASELVHEMALAVSKGLTARDIGETVHSHPTFSEAIMEAAWSGYKKSIHGEK